MVLGGRPPGRVGRRRIFTFRLDLLAYTRGYFTFGFSFNLSRGSSDSEGEPLATGETSLRDVSPSVEEMHRVLACTIIMQMPIGQDAP